LSKEPNVHFDVGRQVKARYWIKTQEGWEQDVGEGQVVDWPAGDVCNDDARQTDEDVVPTKDFLFSIDGPGLATDAPEIAPEISGQQNFKEFARVTFDGSKPQGNNDNGSRCSGKLEWQSFYWWSSTPSPTYPGRLAYKVSPDAPAAFNKIGLGHGTIQSP
jgi:hypothetical protein